MKYLFKLLLNILIIFLLLCIVKSDSDQPIDNGINVSDIDTSNDIEWKEALPRYQLPVYDDKKGNVEWFPRIIGGTNAQLGEFPAKASIQTRRGFHFCGGSLLDMTHILTAAHCLTDERGRVFNPNNIQVMANDLSITRLASDSRQVRFPTHIFIHPSYDLWNIRNDIALIRVSVPFRQTSTLWPLQRATVLPIPWTKCSLAGWGATEEDGSASPILQRVDLDIIPMIVCNGSTSYRGTLGVGMFCAGTMAGGRDSCQGDSGGGLICNNRITGIVSFGFGCGRRNFPGVYTDISFFNNWIDELFFWDSSHIGIPTPTTVRPGGSANNTKCKIILTIGCVLIEMLFSWKIY